jgi:hypothetical protein
VVIKNKKGDDLMSIYAELIKRVEEGETFHIDFEKRIMKVGKEYLIKADEEYTQQELFGKLWSIDCDYSLRVVLHMIRELYKVYKYSLPSERSDSKRKKYFKALSVDELTDEQLMVADKREVAQAAIEGFILCTILTGHLVWDEDIMDGKWFWQSKNDPDLVILRSWIEGK